ncbi:hypothetical protein [Methylocapsa acidiphila]|uniref:hypothetical protein n=1 Tax=Methylocapsa acidiphila TaxID=133552 RepID=UPI00055E138E|nr:hypothetical protein [Methylocapsa acidiphila]
MQPVAIERSVTTYNQITIAECAALCGLDSNEMILGVTPTIVHESLYASYMLHSKRGRKSVCEAIIADIRASLDLRELTQAADCLIVLRRFLSEEGINNFGVPCFEVEGPVIGISSKA